MHNFAAANVHMVMSNPLSTALVDLRAGTKLSVCDAFAQLPEFRMCKPEDYRFAADEGSRLIVRTPTKESPEPGVLAVVSPRYGLVQHREVLRGALDWVKSECGVSPTQIELGLSETGGHAAFRFDLGKVRQISPDGFPVNLQLIVRNTVDRTSSIRAHLGWLRLICSNGMVVGVIAGRTRKTHRDDVALGKIFTSLSGTLGEMEQDQETLEAWAARNVTLDEVRKLSNGILARRWDRVSAARVWHICESGRDARFVPPFRGQVPTDQPVRFEGTVPGSPCPVGTLYDVAQAMSWVATRKRGLDESEMRQREIGHIISSMWN